MSLQRWSVRPVDSGSDDEPVYDGLEHDDNGDWVHWEDVQELLTRVNADICQTLGKVLGYPRYADDPENFPCATEADGVCVGDHVAETLAEEAARRIEGLQAQVAFMDVLQKRVASLDVRLTAAEEVFTARGKPIYGFHEEQYPIYSHEWSSELQSPMTADEANALVERIKELEAKLKEQK